MAINPNKKYQFRKIETILRHYGQYKAGIRNLKKQLDYILPSMTVNYEAREGSNGSFVLSSTTEKYAIDRIESKRALDINEQIRQYTLVVEAVEEAITELAKMEREFVQYRYFNGFSIRKTAGKLGYTEQNLFPIRNKVMDKLLISMAGILEFY